MVETETKLVTDGKPVNWRRYGLPVGFQAFRHPDRVYIWDGKNHVDIDPRAKSVKEVCEAVSVAVAQLTAARAYLD